MSLLSDINLNDVPDLALVPEGEYLVRIAGAEEKLSKAGAPMYVIRIELPEVSDTKQIYEYFVLPTHEDDQNKANTKLRRIKKFVLAFRINPKNIETWVGAEAFAAVGVRPAEGGFEESNTIKNYAIPADARINTSDAPF